MTSYWVQFDANFPFSYTLLVFKDADFKKESFRSSKSDTREGPVYSKVVHHMHVGSTYSDNMTSSNIPTNPKVS